MLRCAIAFFACVLAAPLAYAQSGGTPGWPKVFEVTADKLNLRAGIGQNYRVLITVKRGDLLVGEEEQVGWIRVRPPKGIRCYVSRDFIDGGVGGPGKVNADHVNLRPTAGTTHPPLLQLNRGDSVRVLGESEGWYEIEAPQAVLCWGTKDHLRETGPWTGRENTVDVVGGGELPRGADRGPTPGGVGEHPTGTRDPGGATEHPGGTKDPGGVAEHPTGTRDPGGVAEHPGGTKDPGGVAEHPTGTRDPGGVAEHPTGTRDPGGVAEHPGGAGEHPSGTEQPVPGGTGVEEGLPLDPDAGIEPGGTSGPVEELPPVADSGRASFEEGMRLTRIEDEKEVRDQDFRAAIRQFEIALVAGLPPDLKLRAEVEMRRLQTNQKILDELRSQDREIRAISEAEKRRQREAARDRREPDWVAQGWVDGVGKIINRPAAHKLVKGKKTLYFLSSIRFNLNDFHGKRVGVRGKIVDAPGWEYKVIIVDEIQVLGD